MLREHDLTELSLGELYERACGVLGCPPKKALTDALNDGDNPKRCLTLARLLL